MATTKTLEQIILTRKRQCCKCKKTMQRGDKAIKHTHEATGTISYCETMYWCDDCENKMEGEK